MEEDYFLLSGEKIKLGQRLKRPGKVMKSSHVSKRVGVKLHWYTQPAFKSFSKINFILMKNLINQLPSSSSKFIVDILWHSSSIF